jgi:hypothetical protein
VGDKGLDESRNLREIRDQGGQRSSFVAAGHLHTPYDSENLEVELAEVVSAWPALAADVRAEVLSLVRAKRQAPAAARRTS